MASACSLVLDPDPPSITEEIADAEIAALVRVVAEFEPPGGYRASYEVEYTRVWKGAPVPGLRVEVVDSSCGSTRFDVGDAILIIEEEARASYLMMGGDLGRLPEVLGAVGEGATPATDPVRFARLNTHVPVPLPMGILDPLVLLRSSSAQWAALGAALVALAAALAWTRRVESSSTRDNPGRSGERR